MQNIIKISLIIFALVIIVIVFSSKNTTKQLEHLTSSDSATEQYVPANYQKVGNMNYLKLSDALYSPNVLSSSILANNVSSNKINTRSLNAQNIDTNKINLDGVPISKNTFKYLESENSNISKIVQNIQSEMSNIKPMYSTSGKLVNDKSLMHNIKFSNNWSGHPDSDFNGAEISNDTNKFKTLMIVGNKSRSEGNGRHSVGIWDELDVHGQLNVTGGLAGIASPSELDWAGNGIFKANNYELKNQFIALNPGNNSRTPSIISTDSESRGLNIITKDNTPIRLNDRDVLKELDKLNAKLFGPNNENINK